MKNICLNGLNNTAPTELNKSCVQKFYDDFAPTELIFAIENQINQLVYELDLLRAGIAAIVTVPLAAVISNAY